MKLYHYAPKENTVLTQGLLSFSKTPKSGSIKGYVNRAGSDNYDDIVKWLECGFSGRSRSISCLTEPIKWQGNDIVLKAIVNRSELFSFELDDLIEAGLVEAIWCKDGLTFDNKENFYQVTSEQITTKPLAWEKVDASKELLYAVIKHYLIVLKNGYIPPQYLTLEK